MSNSKTRLQHTYRTDEPFDCMTGDLSDQGLLIVIDKRTHELVIPKEQETEETVTVIVRPRGIPQAGTEQSGAIGARRARVKRDVAEATRRGLELFWRRRRGRARLLTPEGEARSA